MTSARWILFLRKRVILILRAINKDETTWTSRRGRNGAARLTVNYDSSCGSANDVEIRRLGTC